MSEDERLKSAQQIIQQELKRNVIINDDGSTPMMFDLRIGSSDKPEIAIEVTGAVDKQFTETWNIGPGKGPLKVSPINGDWNITIDVGTCIKTFKQKVPQLLQMLESQNHYCITVDDYLQIQDPTMLDYLNSLGIKHASCYRLPGTGKVHYTLPGQSGVVSERGTPVPQWISHFLISKNNKDNLQKLKKSGASICHVFIWVELNGAPLQVEDYLSGDIAYVPDEAPDLPSPISGVWLVATMNGGKGLRWDGTTWRVFRTTDEGIND